MLTRAGESRDNDPWAWSKVQALHSNELPETRLPNEATSAHASSATACSVRSAAASSDASPVLIRSSGRSRNRVTVSQHVRTSAGSSPCKPLLASLHASAASLTRWVQSGNGGQRRPLGGATTKRYAPVWSRIRFVSAKTSGGHQTSSCHAGAGANAPKYEETVR